MASRQAKGPAGEPGGLSLPSLPASTSVVRHQRKVPLADLLEIVGRQLAAAVVSDELELDLLPFSQVAEAGALDGTDMDEGILAAVVRLDEAKALGRVEPLHGSRHGKSFL